MSFCPLNTVYCTLHTAHCTLHTTHCTLHQPHYTMHQSNCTQHTCFYYFPCLCQQVCNNQTLDGLCSYWVMSVCDEYDLNILIQIQIYSAWFFFANRNRNIFGPIFFTQIWIQINSGLIKTGKYKCDRCENKYLDSYWPIQIQIQIFITHYTFNWICICIQKETRVKRNYSYLCHSI